jgi:hypothetical protein
MQKRKQQAGISKRRGNGTGTREGGTYNEEGEHLVLGLALKLHREGGSINSPQFIQQPPRRNSAAPGLARARGWHAREWHLRGCETSAGKSRKTWGQHLTEPSIDARRDTVEG